MKIRSKVTQIAAGVALASAAFVATTPAQACGNDGTMGAICMTAATFCPRNTVDTSGQLLAISQFQALYALIGTQYGGNGVTTFGIPDLRSRTPVGYGQGINLSPVQMGEMRGLESVVLQQSQLAEHTHAMTGAKTAGASINTTIGATASDASSAEPVAGGVLAKANRSNVYAASGTDVQLAGPTVTVPALDVEGSVANTGGNQPVYNISPQQGVRFCMYSVGLFPSRN